MIAMQRIGKSLVVAGLAVLAALLVAEPARAAFEDVYSEGHADVLISYDPASNSLHLTYEFGSNARINGVLLGAAGAGEREADTITVFLDDNALGTGPAGLPAPFAGNPLWIAPQTSQNDKPFLGIGAEEIEPGIFQNDVLTLTLTGLAQRPAGGEFVLWQIGSEGSPFLNSADGFSVSDAVVAGAGGHDHFNWSFTAEGIYDLNLTATGMLLNGTVLTTSAVYRFQVGAPQVVPEPGTLALAGLGGLGLLFQARRHRRRATAQDTR